MKKWKFILMMCLCTLFAVSCSKDDDTEDLGRTNIDDIPTGKIALSKYGMWAIFPEDGWSNYTNTDYKNLSGHWAEFNRDCIATYLREDSISFAGNVAYKTVIYFSRFDKMFDTEAAANDLIAEYREVLDGMCDLTGDDPTLDFLSVSEVDFATIGNYTGSLIETVDKGDMYQANYFVYSKEDSRLYMVTLSLENEHFKAKDEKYQDCMTILNTFKLKEE